MDIPEYIVILQPRNPSNTEIGQIYSATVAYNITEAESIAHLNTDDLNFAIILPCDYSMRSSK